MSAVLRPAWGAKPALSTLASSPKKSFLEIQQEEADASLAKDLSASLNRHVEPEEQSFGDGFAEPVVEPLAGDETTLSDEALARLLQEEFDHEHDSQIYVREKLQNLGNSHVSISMKNHRLLPQTSTTSQPDDEEGEESECTPQLHDAVFDTHYDKSKRVFRTNEGEIVTKHNAVVCGTKNKRKIQSMHIASGDIEGAHEFTLSNRIYNSLKMFSERSQGSRFRLHEQKEFSTSEMALDRKTRLVIFKLINSGVLEAVHGCISSGKESVVFLGERKMNPEDPESKVELCAVKVFKTTITEFKGRAQFLTGDRRFDARIGKQSVRKLVKLWAEKEMVNLSRMNHAGMPCPQAFTYKQHVLVMSFLGQGDVAAPKLKEAKLSTTQLATCYRDVCQLMKSLYNDCRLVHADLSEYNILYHNEQPYVIDVGQAVDTQHHRAREYLFNDCQHITQYFTKLKVATQSAVWLFNFITGEQTTTQDVIALTQQQQQTRKQLIRTTDDHMSDVCLRADLPVDSAFPAQTALVEDSDEDDGSAAAPQTTQEVSDHDSDWLTTDDDGDDDDEDDDEEPDQATRDTLELLLDSLRAKQGLRSKRT
eukprot:m.185769 g.185769  ORF g.185769 m.185769 type:complete len:593 (-) comp53548_c0_seq2:97-1875(-)